MTSIIVKFRNWLVSGLDKIQRKEKQEVRIPEKEPEIAEKKEIVGFCALCQQDIYKEEKTSNLNGNIVHKRCFKRAKRDVLQGKRLNLN